MPSKGRIVPQKPKLLIVADAVSHTGFATVTHNIADRLRNTYDISILALNYHGDPHSYPYPIYPAVLGGDMFGVRRLPSILAALKPDVVLAINDPWIVRDYIPSCKQAGVKFIAYVPVDSPNMRSDFAEALNGADLIIGYTQFAIEELKTGGMDTRTAVIPHGTDRSVFQAITTDKARQRMEIPNDWFIVGCVGRNQPRKRIDLAMLYFREFAKDKPENVKFYYHGAVDDSGWSIIQLARYLGIEDRMVITDPRITAGQGIDKDMMKYVYNSFNVHIGTQLG